VRFEHRFSHAYPVLAFFKREICYSAALRYTFFSFIFVFLSIRGFHAVRSEPVSTSSLAAARRICVCPSFPSRQQSPGKYRKGWTSPQNQIPHVSRIERCPGRNNYGNQVGKKRFSLSRLRRRARSLCEARSHVAFARRDILDSATAGTGWFRRERREQQPVRLLFNNTKSRNVRQAQ
jgi:hypothetical protein